MSLLIVTYDLNKEPNSQAYGEILGVIKSGKNWARLSESSYAMDTSLTPRQVYDRVKPFLDNGDSLLVLSVVAPYFGQHSQKVIDWLAAKPQLHI